MMVCPGGRSQESDGWSVASYYNAVALVRAHLLRSGTTRRPYRMVTVTTLNLVREMKICDLITSKRPAKRWEASGVLVKDGHYFVVFDDRTEVGRISNDLQPNKANGLFGLSHADFGYEGITYNADKKRFYLLVEARKHSRGCYQASIIEYDDQFEYLKERSVDFTFE